MRYLVFIVFFALLGAKVSAQEETMDGKAIFIANKCTSCHTIQAAGVDVVKKEGEDEGEKDDKAPDLSSVGTEHDAAWLIGYLTKKETLHDKKHMKKFKGADSDLKTLMDWLASQKASAKDTESKE